MVSCGRVERVIRSLASRKTVRLMTTVGFNCMLNVHMITAETRCLLEVMSQKIAILEQND